MEYARDIIVAMINNGYLIMTDDNDKNIEIIKKAIDEIHKQIKDSHKNN